MCVYIGTPQDLRKMGQWLAHRKGFEKSTLDIAYKTIVA